MSTSFTLNTQLVSKQQVSPFIVICFIFQIEVRAVTRNVFETLFVSLQRVSPFYHDSQLLHERNVFRSPENGTFFFHLTRSLGRFQQRVAQFYHDLDLELVSLTGNFWIVAQLVHLVVEHLLNPIPTSNHVSRRSLEEAEVTHILSRF